MKIVYLTPSGQLGGAEIALLDLMASLRHAQPDWPLHLILGSGGPLALLAEALGVSTVALNFPRAVARLGDAGAGGPAGKRVGRPAVASRLALSAAPVALYAKKLRRTLAALRPDLIHTNGFKMHVLGVWSRPAGVPVIWHVHDFVSARPIMSGLLRRCASRCAAVVTNSSSVAEDARRIFNSGPKIYTVLNAVNLMRFSPEGESLDLDAMAGMSAPEPGTVRVGLLATMARWKGHEVFLKALSLSPPGVRGYIIGGALYQTDGSQHGIEDLREIASRLGIAHRVGFTGFVREPEAAMRALDIVVHASTQPEPFGLVIVEAMACARPVIVSLAGGVSEIVDVGENALAHEPGDAVGLAECIERLATDVALRSKLGAAGRATAEARFDSTRLADELIPIYREVRSVN